VTTINRSALVPFSAEKMYNLVNDVDKYPEFLPWCSDAKILEQSDNSMKASVTISGGGISKTFTTKNTLTPSTQIVMEHLEGPFKSLKGTWDFKPLSEEGCRIELVMTFELETGVKAMLFGVVFNKIADKLVDAFTQRARDLFDQETQHDD